MRAIHCRYADTEGLPDLTCAPAQRPSAAARFTGGLMAADAERID